MPTIEELEAQLAAARAEKAAEDAAAARTAQASPAAEVPDHVHVAIAHSEHEGDVATGPVYRGDRPKE